MVREVNDVVEDEMISCRLCEKPTPRKTALFGTLRTYLCEECEDLLTRHVKDEIAHDEIIKMMWDKIKNLEDCEENVGGDMVKVEIDVPEGVMRFLESLMAFTGEDVKDYLRYSIINAVRADMDSCGDSAIWNTEKIRAKYGLDKI